MGRHKAAGPPERKEYGVFFERDWRYQRAMDILSVGLVFVTVLTLAASFPLFAMGATTYAWAVAGVGMGLVAVGAVPWAFCYKQTQEFQKWDSERVANVDARLAGLSDDPTLFKAGANPPPAKTLESAPAEVK